jgi:hypothetical protein
LLTAQAGNTQSQIGTTVLKQDLDAEKSAVLTILGAGSPPSSASVGPGIGGNVDVSA